MIKSTILVFSLLSLSAHAGMMKDGHYTGRCTDLLAVKYAKDSGMSPLLQHPETYHTSDVTVTTENGVQTQVWKNRIYAGGGPQGSPFNFTVVVKAAGKNLERQVTTYDFPKSTPESSIWKIELDGSRSEIETTAFGKTKKQDGYVNEYTIDDGTWYQMAHSNGYKAAGGTRVLSTRDWCVLKPD